jgi:hypothetical protein
MKKLLSAAFALIACLGYGQDRAAKTGAIEVQFISHNYDFNKQYEPTGKRSNKDELPIRIFYLDATGLLLKDIQLGKYHKLKDINSVTEYTYNDSLVTQSDEYQTDQRHNFYPYWKNKYTYNERNLLAEFSEYKADNSLFSSIAYEYDAHANMVKYTDKGHYHCLKNYDTNNRITSYQQIYKDSLVWEWKYTYTANQRTGNFESFHKTDNYAVTEIITYDAAGRIIQLEKNHANHRPEKYIYTYSDGILATVERYEVYSGTTYTKTADTDIKITGDYTNNPVALKRLNKLLIKENLR